ncbi:hypothetical protein [Pseudonocardia alni]|uniref:hypothetical protein n=1 Tax=Pseudonocardia alni TaxID=33907 RepID=UPI00280AE892|nr:hypothetical protein [Pseudonocardia alni]
MNNVHWAPAAGRVRILGCDEAIEVLRPEDGIGSNEVVAVLGDDDDIAVYGTRDELRELIARLQDQVERLALPAARNGGQGEYFEEAWDEVDGSRFDPVCPCGNHPATTGFCFAGRDGAVHSHDEPPESWVDHQTMSCPECGRFYRQNERDERGYPVAGVRPVGRSVDDPSEGGC